MTSRTKHHKLKDSRSRKTHYHAPITVEDNKPFNVTNFMHDLVFGAEPEGHGPQDDNEAFTYDVLITSLDEVDAKLLKPLGDATRRGKKKVAFKHLSTLEYKKFLIPFASDENPLGDVPAHAVVLVVEDQAWGPDLRQADTSELNYFQIIDAAQELAQALVFVFIKGHKDSANYPGVIHPKFRELSKGPWPADEPVFLFSYYEKLNTAQLEVFSACMRTEDPLQLTMEINKHVRAADEWLAAENLRAKVKEMANSPLPPMSSSNSAAKGEGESDTPSAAPSSSSASAAVPESLLSRGLAAHIQREVEAQVRAQTQALHAEIAELKKQVAQLQGGSNTTTPVPGTTPAKTTA
eukprot:TRINITY_DN1057_c1_g1_i1.p1 TRINITY_DN1057_c1_g1~~TRINITY_DN1057_c1_g1_i1.p1  ORF type:complete len:351 (+),score=80.34 TRINITY_DN1057_c1_g1_i1:122-1174(+)